MRVLHIWNTAGVASIMARYQKRLLGWNTWVVMRKVFDRFGLTTYGEVIDAGAKMFTARALWMARKFDIIHVHTFDKIVPLLKMLYPRKKVILHYHGTDIRNRWREKERYWRRSDIVLVSTFDLLSGAPSHVIYLPNPVDMELFRPMPELRRQRTALHIIKREQDEDIDWVRKVARKLDLELTVIDRIKNPIPHSDLPKVLNKFEYYIDQNYIPALSKTALEALACKLKVVRWDEKIIEGLPEEHNPENVVLELKKIIESLLW